MLDFLKNLLGKDTPPEATATSTAAVASENEKVLNEMQMLALKLRDNGQEDMQTQNDEWIQKLRKEGKGF